jgi:hypothetical protein
VFTAEKDFRLTDFTSTQCVLFSELEKRPVVLSFDHVHGSSDGGAILLSAANRRFGAGLIESLSACLQDVRQQGKVDHQLAELMRQRIDGLSCGYEDANDAARIGHDPVHKLLAGRDPVKGLDLASQPTLSRFENSVTPRSLYMMGMTLAESVITRHGKRRNGQLRVLLASAAYVPMQEIRLNAQLTTLARAQVWTLRERLLKLGARVVSSARRIVVHLPESFPWRSDFRRIAGALGATAG